MRVTHNLVASRLRQQVVAGYERMTAAQLELSSGKRVSRPSDDPVAMVTLLSVRREQAQVRRFERSAVDAQSMLASADTALQRANDLLASAVVRSSQFVSGSMSVSSREALALDVEGIKAELLSVVNTQSVGRPLFSGTASVASVYDGAGAYQGNGAVPLRDVAPGVTVAVGFSGPQVFGDGASSVFVALDALAAAIRAGDQAGVASSRASLEATVERVAVATVEVGSRARMVDDALVRTLENQFRLDEDASRLVDSEVEEAVIEFTSSRMAYEATLATSAKIFQTSLIDFLR